MCITTWTHALLFVAGIVYMVFLIALQINRIDYLKRIAYQQRRLLENDQKLIEATLGLPKHNRGRDS